MRNLRWTLGWLSVIYQKAVRKRSYGRAAASIRLTDDRVFELCDGNQNSARVAPKTKRYGISGAPVRNLRWTLGWLTFQSVRHSYPRGRSPSRVSTSFTLFFVKKRNKMAEDEDVRFFGNTCASNAFSVVPF